MKGSAVCSAFRRRTHSLDLGAYVECLEMILRKEKSLNASNVGVKGVRQAIEKLTN